MILIYFFFFVIIEFFFIIFLIYFFPSSVRKVYTYLTNSLKNLFRANNFNVPSSPPLGETIPINIIHTSRCDFLKFDHQFLVVVDNFNIKIFTPYDFTIPVFILKGHTHRIKELTLTDRFIISNSKSSNGIGIWEKFNYFNFSPLLNNFYPLTKPFSMPILSLQVYNNICYYDWSNEIFVNDSEFLNPSSSLLKITSNLFLEEFKVYQDKIYCLITDGNSKYVRIRVYDLHTQVLLISIKEDLRTLHSNYLGSLVVNSSNVIISDSFTILIFNQESKLINKKYMQLDSGDNTFIGATESYYLIKEQKFIRRPTGERNFLKIYSNTSNFDLLREYPIKDDTVVILDDNDDLVIIDNKSSIYQYSIKDLISL